MKKSKKIICIILALVLVVSIGTVMLISNAEDNSRDTSIAITVDKTELKAGESATVTVKATTNYAVGTLSIPVFYDKTLVEVSDGTATLTSYTNKAVTTDLTAVDTSKIYANTGISSEKFGFVLVNYIAGAGTEVDTMLTDAVVLTFKVTAKTNVNGEDIIKVVTESAKTDDNIQGMLYFGAQPDGTTINTIPENVEEIDVLNASTVINISDGANTIALKDDAPYKAVIDTLNTNDGEFTGLIYGIDTLGCNDLMEPDGTLADFITTAYGDDYLEVVVGDAGVETTGTLINVLDENGDVVETYVYIYFGDVDMDGLISSGDGTMIIDYELSLDGIYEEYVLMAADVDGDGMPSSGDGTIIMDYELTLDAEGSYYPTQAEMGEMVQNNTYEIF